MARRWLNPESFEDDMNKVDLVMGSRNTSDQSNVTTTTGASSNWNLSISDSDESAQGDTHQVSAYAKGFYSGFAEGAAAALVQTSADVGTRQPPYAPQSSPQVDYSQPPRESYDRQPQPHISGAQHEAPGCGATSPNSGALEDSVSTVMVRQVPRKCTQLELLGEINRRGFEGSFDYVYFPYDLKKKCNVGYGFLNFTEDRFAAAFHEAFDGTFLDNGSRFAGKPLRVHPATTQGFQANLFHFWQKNAGQHQDPHHSPLFALRAVHDLLSQRMMLSTSSLSQLCFATPGSTNSASWVTIEHIEALVSKRQAPQTQPAPRRSHFCHSCGASRGHRHNFCHICGTQLE